jgi:membrane fusion protein, multidrug efflux system
MKRSRYVVAGSVGLASILAAGAWFSFRAPAVAAARPLPTERARPPLVVTGVHVHPIAFAETITASGTLRAEESVELQAEVNGKVIALNFREGAAVQAGELLVKIDDSSLQASLRRVEARRELAQFREQRIRQLLAQGGFSQQAYDEARSEVAIQDAEADVIRAEIRKTEIRAPFDGIVGLRFVSLGAYVNPSARIATLQRIHQLKLDFSIPERYITRVDPGARLRFTVAGSSDVHEGEVYAVEPRIDVGTRSVLLRAVSENTHQALLPGTFARVELTVTRAEDALLVPAIAVIAGLEERFVFVMRGGRAERVAVRLGARTATEVHVIEGLAPGDVVLTSGLQQLRAGMPVQLPPPL